MNIPLIIGISIVSLVVFVFVSLLIIYIAVYYSPLVGQMSDRRLKNIPQNAGYEQAFIDMVSELIKIPYDDVFITSFDKLKLHAKVYRNSDSNRVAILCHGYRATGYRDFAGIAKGFIDEGLSVVLIDQRAHGQSGGHSITLGVKEVKDVLEWIKYAKKEFGEDKQIVLMGFSMGGATVLNCVDKVRDDTLIIADSPFCYPRELLEASIKSVKLSPTILYPIANLSSIVFSRTSMNHLNAYEAIRNSKCNILIIHGNADRIVPQSLSQQLAETYPDKIKYEIFPGADHGISYLKDYKRYRKLVINFIKKD